MTKDYPGEQWKDIVFDFEFVNQTRLLVSNFGRIKTFNSISDGKILNGSMIGGYRIVRLKFFKEKNLKSEKVIVDLRQEIQLLTKKIKLLKEEKESKTVIEQCTAELNSLKKIYAKKYRDAEKKRTIYYHALIHRLVATYFLRQPSPEHSVVAHLDFNKLNNRTYNLKWMTPTENYAHQLKSPYVIAEKEGRIANRKSTATKLSVTKVMLLKKLLNQNKPIKQLAKQFRITDTQIMRIKKGINWGHVDAAR